jgi:hypothetical protein
MLTYLAAVALIAFLIGDSIRMARRWDREVRLARQTLERVRATR